MAMARGLALARISCRHRRNLLRPAVRHLATNADSLPASLQYISLYNYTPLEEAGLPRLQRRVRATWRQLGVLGRIYISTEGINAQLVVPEPNVDALLGSFPPLLADAKLFYGHLFDYGEQAGDQSASAIAQPFAKLDVRVRDQIVRDGFTRGALDLRDSGASLPPGEWHRKLRARNAAGDASTLVLDVRNFYEHEVGRFDGATRVMVDTFRDTFDALDDILEAHAAAHEGQRPREVMMYCTGGIRCEKAGAYLRQFRGVDRVHKLHGGIVNYAKFLKDEAHGRVESLFKGKNFVFDQRCVGEGATDFEQLTPDVLGACFQCGEPCDRHANCSNLMCGGLVLHCDKCRAALLGACSRACKEEALKMQAMSPDERRAHRKQHSDRWKPLVPNALSRYRQQAHTSQIRGRSATSRALHSSSRLSQERIDAAPASEVTSIFKTEILHDHGYAFESSSALEDAALLRELREATAREWPKAEQLIDESQGQFLRFLVQSARASRVLEIGCFTGYSALCLANGLAPSGSLVTCDVDSAAVAFARRFFARSARCGQVEAVEMDALRFLEAAHEPFDVIFVDANKRQYRAYYEEILGRRLLRPGGLLLFDNTLFRGRVAAAARGEASGKERLARGLAGFNAHVAADPRTSQVLLPLWDGLTLVRLADADDWY